jgi:hypothetical protein
LKGIISATMLAVKRGQAEMCIRQLGTDSDCLFESLDRGIELAECLQRNAHSPMGPRQSRIDFDGAAQVFECVNWAADFEIESP